MKMIIKNIIGQRCIVKEAGHRVYDAIHEALKRSEYVTLDFKGVTQFASPFFNFAIGQLLKDITEKDLRRLLHIENLNSTGRLVVERVIDIAGRYHTNVDYRKIIDEILDQQARESC